MRKTLLTAVLAATIIALSATGAVAAENGPYPPYTPTPPSLAGSQASAVCVHDVPWINYSVQLTDPDNQAKSHFAYLLLKHGTDSVEIPLGELVDGAISGSVLWPGASVDTTGAPTGWPGWAEVGG